MKKTDYRLQTVLEIRTNKKDEAAKGVAACLATLEEEEIELNRKQNALDHCHEMKIKADYQLNKLINKGLAAHLVLQHRNYLNDLKSLEIKLESELEEQKHNVETAKRYLEISRLKLIESTKELQAIENHKSNWKTSEYVRKSKKEQKLSDEIGLILHEQKKSNK